jgi:hypothetical protein
MKIQNLPQIKNRPNSMYHVKKIKFQYQLILFNPETPLNLYIVLILPIWSYSNISQTILHPIDYLNTHLQLKFSLFIYIVLTFYYYCYFILFVVVFFQFIFKIYQIYTKNIYLYIYIYYIMFWVKSYKKLQKLFNCKDKL